MEPLPVVWFVAIAVLGELLGGLVVALAHQGAGLLELAARELERGGVPYTDVRCYETRILSPDGQALRRLAHGAAEARPRSSSR